ncbi:hypothetical protein [Thalassomonas sp. RHCl1]|uniref:hypothetical protein n=1 Tax=Thalassomonas sp. RHCl1 TaxID=2995320 RepID=UPI00248C6DB9|nr:hypothetical protein [Thalassomonas sp. RHCl1]
MQGSAFIEKKLTAALVRIVKHNLSEGDELSAHFIEKVLNNFGISRASGISVYHMLEARALVLYEFGIDRYNAELREALIYFIADYPVFRWSELRYCFSDPEQEVASILHELKYCCRELDLDGEREYVWSSRWLWERTVKKRLARRTRIGDPAFFEFLNYQPESKNT